MTDLQKAVDTLSNERSKLFGDVYSHIRSEEYDEERDELETAITGLDGNTQQIFSLSITPLDNKNRFNPRSYKVETRYFQVMKAVTTVPGKLLLDFLLNAKIVVHPHLHQMSFSYKSM